MLLLPQLALAAGPEISGVTISDIGETTAEISWTTNTTSDSRVNYGITTALGQTKYDSTQGTTHNVILTGLTQGTKYYFEVESTDISGTNTSNNGGVFYSFTTLAPATYSITLEPACGVCGELIEPENVFCNEIIEVTATVAAAGTYYICWDAKAAWNPTTATGVVGTFTAAGAGVYTLTFYMPEAKKGPHDVYLVDSAYVERAKAVPQFGVLPFVKIDPEEGPVGTEVTLNGYGFNIGQQIQIKFKDTVITPTTPPLTAGAKGSWTFSYKIPPTPAGGYIFEVEAKEGTEFWPFANKYFEVIPKITVTPDSGTVGKVIKVDGTGFASKEVGVKITFDGEVRRENSPVDVDGSWTDYITVPIRTCGRYLIDASGTSTRARDVDDVTFTLVPGISVEPTSAYVGDTITIRGGGFAPEETGIQVYFEGVVVTTAAITADIYGCWESSFTLPASTYGSHTVSASGATTQPAVSTTLNTKAKIEGVSPVEGAPGDFVRLGGSGFNGNKKLTVKIGGIAASETMQTQTNGNVDITFRVPKGSTEGQRTLEVTDEGGASNSTYFTVTKKTLSTTPLPISPKDSTLRSGKVTFKWQGATGNNGYTYTLEIVDHWSKSDIPGSSYTLTDTETVTETLPKGTYYWRVKLVDDYGNESAWSDSIEFKVSPIPTWVWVVVGLVVLVGLMVVAYRETKFKVTE
jgi:hypothetical protein